MKIDWKTRFKNPYFWIGLIGIILTAMGAKPEMFTSWDIVLQQLRTLFGNPFLLGTVVMAVLGVFTDPTSKGLQDHIKEQSKKMGK